LDSYAIETYLNVLNGTTNRFPRDFWQDDENKHCSDAAEITRYLIEEILGWNEDTIKAELCCKTFFEHKLKGMLCTLFNDSFFQAIDNAYPGKYKEWEFSCTPRNFWNEETAKQATIWLFRERLKMTDEEIKRNISRKIFVENGLDTMMHVIYNNNASMAISNAFPELF
jgi:hypothetical protein